MYFPTVRTREEETGAEGKLGWLSAQRRRLRKQPYKKGHDIARGLKENKTNILYGWRSIKRALGQQLSSFQGKALYPESASSVR